MMQTTMLLNVELVKLIFRKLDLQPLPLCQTEIFPFKALRPANFFNPKIEFFNNLLVLDNKLFLMFN